MGVWYCTREDIKSALDIKESARTNAQVDRIIEASSRMLDGKMHRAFYPQTDTRYFPWPAQAYGTPWRLWLDADEVISVDILLAAGTEIPSSDYFLEPGNAGPPYTHIEIDLASTAAFSAGSTYQRAIAITGEFGYSADEEPAGALAEALDNSETAVDVTDSTIVGVGHIIKVDSERMIVTGKSMLTTGQTLQIPITASAADVTVAVTTGSAFAAGEVILLDSERMRIDDIAGNSLLVKRAWDGTPLAAHTGSTIYAPRTLTVSRGALGTTSATHSNSASITKHVVPYLIRLACIAKVIDTLQQEGSGYARTIGSGESVRQAGGKAVTQVIDDAYAEHGRKIRARAV